MTYRFTLIITQEGKWFVARAVELGVVSQGKTIEEAKKNIQEAAELFLEDEHIPISQYAFRHAPLVTSLEVKHA